MFTMTGQRTSTNRSASRQAGLTAAVIGAMLCLCTHAAPAQDARSMQQEPPADQSTADEQQPTPETKEAEAVYVRMTTNKGEIILELNAAKAPKTVENFVAYVKDEFYDATIFHRVIKEFMIQGGGFTEDLKKKPTREGVENEWQNGLKNERGTISMARIGGRPNSGTSQFFINTVDNPSLDRAQPDGAAYAVFGKVVAGMDTVDAIRSVPVQVSPLNRREISYPTETVMIEQVRIISRDEAQQAIDKAKQPAESSETSEPAPTPGNGE